MSSGDGDCSDSGSSQEDSCSTSSSAQRDSSRHCDCCYCEVFGHGVVSNHSFIVQLGYSFLYPDFDIKILILIDLLLD